MAKQFLTSLLVVLISASDGASQTTGGRTGPVTPVSSPLLSIADAASGDGWRGDYYSDEDLGGSGGSLVATRIDASLNFPDYVPPPPALGRDVVFSVRWT